MTETTFLVRDIHAAEERGYEFGVAAAMRSLEVRFDSYLKRTYQPDINEHEKSVVWTVGEAKDAIRKLKEKHV